MLEFLTNVNKNIVGIAITPNVGLEVMLIDKKTLKVVKYGHKHIGYNLSTREPDDYNSVKSALTELYSDLQIDTKSSVYIVVPNVHFGFISLPSIMIDEAIDNALLSKAEESYIFRRVEPKTAWADINFKNRTDSRYLAYAAIQVTVVDKLKEMITDMGGNLIGIESSYCAFLRAIHFSEIAKDQIEQEENWNILLITSNSYAIFSLIGEKLVDYTEVPLALKSFSYEEAYQAIATSASQVLASYPAKKLLIISQSDEISAEVLKTQIAVDDNIQVLDCNKFTKVPLVQIASNITDKEANTMSLSVIGAATAKISKFPTSLNVLSSNNSGMEITYLEKEIFGRTVVFTAETIGRYMAIACIIAFAFFATIDVGIYGIKAMVTAGNASVKKELEAVEAEIQKIESVSTVNIENLISKIVDVNVKSMNFYDSLSLDIPKDIWLTSYVNQNGENVKIEGMSLGINEIYTYYKNLKIISPSSNMTLNKLKMITNMFDSSYDISTIDNEIKFYTFEIGNIKGTTQIAADGEPTDETDISAGGSTGMPQEGDLSQPPQEVGEDQMTMGADAAMAGKAGGGNNKNIKLESPPNLEPIQ